MSEYSLYNSHRITCSTDRYDSGYTGLPEKTLLQGITHVIFSFANMQRLATGTSDKVHFEGFDGVNGIRTIREKFDSGTKFGAALGGWDESPWFNQTFESGDRAIFIDRIMDFVKEFNLDFIDIDWEYPGGGGVNYMNDTDASKEREIEVFPVFLKELREKLQGEDGKQLSIAVAGKPNDIKVYKEKSKDIWASVDFVNIMAYDLMNRRDTETAFPSSVKGANAAVDAYLGLGLPAEKINLGIPLYSKFAKLADETCQGPLGCPLAPAENDDGSDAHTMDAVTFEKQNFQSTKVTTGAANGNTCGSDGFGCASGLCCSKYGACGNETEYCGYMCQYMFGDCDPTWLDMMPSFQRAIKNGKMDNDEGAMWFIDRPSEGDGKYNHFWSWDSPEIITKKINDIVFGRKLGGSMAWALGHDTYDWKHVKAIHDAHASAPDKND